MMPPPSATAMWEQALARDPADIVALRQLAQSLVGAGNGLHGLRLILRAERLSGQPPAPDAFKDAVNSALMQTAAWLESADADRAAAALEWLAGVAPYGQVRRALASTWLIQGRDDEARRLNDSLGEPEGGLTVALEAVQRHRVDSDFVGTIVVPVFRMADTVERALDSIAAAVRHFRNATRRPLAQFHICVVDDGSADRTPTVVLDWGLRNPDVSLALVANNRNRGAGRARNAGVAAALGDLVWFLDADDYFLERHLLVTAEALSQHPEIGYVRTAIEFDAIDTAIRPAWRDAAEASWPNNLCIRRPCHERVGGFPEEAPFYPAVADDVAYSRALRSVFGGRKIAEKTAHYTLRPGNALDRQRAAMVSVDPQAAGRVAGPQFVAIELLTLRRIHALKAERAVASVAAAEAPPTPPDDAVLRIEHGRRLREAGRSAEATAAFAAALQSDPGSAEAWFENGLQAYFASEAGLGDAAFRRAAALRPAMTPAQVNFASALIATGRHALAVAPLHLALAVQPSHANAIHLLGQALQRGGQPHAASTLHARAMRLEPGRAEFAAHRSLALAALGANVDAIASARRAVTLAPDQYDGQAAHANALETAGLVAAALAAWERAIRCNPGFGEAFTRRGMLLLDRRWGPLAVRSSPRRPGRRLMASSLGRNGRFGNQLLQYGLLRLYADRHDLDLEVPLWPGRFLYDRDDPLPGAPLPPLAEHEADIVGSLTGANPAVFAGHDIDGYFCGDTSPLAPVKESFRALFQPGARIAPFAAAATGHLRSHGDTVVAIHLRRGDFGWGRFWIAPETWYLRWLEQVWPALDNPVLYVASDDPGCVAAFSAYRPLVASDLAPPLEGAEYFTDFHILSAADLVAVSNSSFSFVASMLNRSARRFMRPDRAAQALVGFDPWSSPVLI